MLNGRVIVKEAVVAYFKLLFQHMPEGAEENREKLQ
jgi:hypothetical protein